MSQVLQNYIDGNQSAGRAIRILNNERQVRAFMAEEPSEDTIGVSSPLVSRELVIIGLHSPSQGPMCINIHINMLKEVATLLYESPSHSIAVHGIKAIWEDLGNREPGTRLDMVTCTRLISYLLHPEWDDYQYRLDYLAEHYLGEFAGNTETRDALKILNKASSEVLSGNLKGAVPDIDLNVAIPLLAEASSVIIRRWKTGGSSILENLRTD